MNKGQLSSKYYWLSEVYDCDQLIFNHEFHFVALSDVVSENNDFFVFEKFEKSYFLYNANGTIRCFENYCLHRGAKLFIDKVFGNGRIICPYHNWVYTGTGQCENFEANLIEVPITIIGKFIFLNGSVDLSFDKNLTEILERLSLDFIFVKRQNLVNHRANWKLLIENVLECYHCLSVHQNTLAKWGMGRRPLEDIKLDHKFSSCVFPIERFNKSGSQIYLDKILQNNDDSILGFKHIYVFPNLLISNVEGKYLYVGRLNLLSPNNTDLTFNIGLPEHLRTRTIEDKDLIVETLTKSSEIIINEDKIILESQQVNLDKRDNYPFLSKDEIRINHFHEMYLKNFKKYVN